VLRSSLATALLLSNLSSKQQRPQASEPNGYWKCRQ
jgi:hypothetical protein